MAQLALYIDDETASRIDQIVRKCGMSRSAWVRDVVLRELDNRFPESFFQVLGTWEDKRNTDEILKDIRTVTHQSKRPEIE